ncbi:glycosyltransferase family 2 protein [Acinetobacter sp. ANC 4178]|uniref:glycosyltransferase family 2 protein n=1 Tax=Acinetobacter sp. ANC 4178 TaxID=2529839 RepID=UPI00103CECA2|nr:glycosyltransferase family 2 protein [Acinetobacter sp. ANC 4178]TCB65059.1 glycosyltransferase [Acinetobacter sp. ANC 4178]
MYSKDGVSVAIPIYNAEKFLSDAIQSVINQSFKEWELILVDDGSTDRSLEIAKEFERKDSRIKVISDGLNLKLPTRLNQIISLSKYEFIARMDADDIMHPDRLRVQYDFLKNNEYDLVSSSLYSIDINNNIVGKRIIDSPVTIQSLLRGNNQIAHPTILAKKNWYLRNMYDEQSERAEDYELWLRSILNKDLKVHVLPEPLLYYREVGNITKEKLLLSYKTTGYIYKKFKENIGSIYYLKASFNNLFKKNIVNILFYLGKEGYLVKRRNDNFISSHELENARNNLALAVKSDE